MQVIPISDCVPADIKREAEAHDAETRANLRRDYEAGMSGFMKLSLSEKVRTAS
jgi:hypothetical protein